MQLVKVYLFKGITVDEGSNMVRLFSQIENSTNVEEHLIFSDQFEVHNVNSDEESDSTDTDSEFEENCFEKIDEEIEFSLKEISSLKFSETQNTEIEDMPVPYDIDFESEYDTTRGASICNLEIEIGSDLLPRISCAAHKANISVRASIKNHDPNAKLLKALSKFCATSHRSINITSFHNLNKGGLDVITKHVGIQHS